MVAGVGPITIEQGGLVLVGDDDIHCAAVEQVAEGDGAAVVEVVHADAIRDVHPAGDAAIEIDARPLVARQARVAERGPRTGVLEEAGVRAGDLRHRIPVVLVSIGRDETVGDEQLVGAVVVEVAELRAPRPAGVGDGALGDVAEAARLAQVVHAQVVVLEDVAALGDVRDVRVEAAAVERVAERDGHPAL